MEQYARLVRPDVTVVTSIGSEHHGSLGSLEVTREEKARMISAMPASGIAVLNGDDPQRALDEGARAGPGDRVRLRRPAATFAPSVSAWTGRMERAFTSRHSASAAKWRFAWSAAR